MDDVIYVFTGSKKDFEKFLIDTIPNDENVRFFMELVRDFNAYIRNKHHAQSSIDVDNLVVHADDYASVYEHVIQNFINIVTTNHNVSKTYLHNPPKRVLDALLVSYSEVIVYKGTEYTSISRSTITEIWNAINTRVVGQDEAKKSIVTNLYKLCNKNYVKPVVLMLLGDSGIGKTETAKVISEILGGNLQRLQFSMMQTSEGYNYVFGSEHSKSSFAKDLLLRESNIVLIDEFDKVNPMFYNAFYQLFDEGRYTDTNYSVDVSRCIFICTTNFNSKEKAIEQMGFPIFSRFDDVINYVLLSNEEKIKILEMLYNAYFSKLQPDEQALVEKSDVLDWHRENITRYKSVRIIKNRLEKAINKLLVEKFVFSQAIEP